MVRFFFLPGWQTNMQQITVDICCGHMFPLTDKNPPKKQKTKGGSEVSQRSLDSQSVMSDHDLWHDWRLPVMLQCLQVLAVEMRSMAPIESRADPHKLLCRRASRVIGATGRGSWAWRPREWWLNVAGGFVAVVIKSLLFKCGKWILLLRWMYPNDMIVWVVCPLKWDKLSPRFVKWL